MIKLQMIMPKTDWLQSEYPIPASSWSFDDKFTEDKLHDVKLYGFIPFIDAIPAQKMLLQLFYLQWQVLFNQEDYLLKQKVCVSYKIRM